jgi:hypothetical protein
MKKTILFSLIIICLSAFTTEQKNDSVLKIYSNDLKDFIELNKLSIPNYTGIYEVSEEDYKLIETIGWDMYRAVYTPTNLINTIAGKRVLNQAPPECNNPCCEHTKPGQLCWWCSVHVNGIFIYEVCQSCPRCGAD